MPALSIRLLGPVAVSVDDLPIDVDTRKAIALLAVLATAKDPQPRALLMSLLWPDNDEQHAAGALRRTLSVLRTALGGRWVEPREGAVALQGPGIDSDVETERRLWAELETARESGRDTEAGVTDTATETALLERIVALHRGAFLAGFSLRDSAEFDEWQAATARDAERRLSTALARLARRLAESGRVADAVAHAERLVALDPLNEASYRELMRLHAAAGDRASAVRVYRACVRVLDEQLSVPPLGETTALYRTVIEGRGAEDAPDGGVASAPPIPTVVPPPSPTIQHPFVLPLVGRDRELRTLERLWGAATSGGQLAIVEGEPGIGKTRLAHELAETVRAAGGFVLTVGCYREDRRVPYAPVVEILRRLASSAPDRLGRVPSHAHEEAARLLPEIAATPAGTTPRQPIDGRDDPSAPARFVAGLTTTLATALSEPVGSRRPPGLLVVDDAHWADPPSADLLARLSRRLPEVSLLVVIARRPPQRDEDPFAALLTPAAVSTTIELSRLAPAAVEELAQRAGAAADLPDLQAASEGVPFYIAEWIATHVPGQTEIDPSRGVVALLEARLEAISQTASQILGAAAVMGRSFDPDLVREVAGRTEEETVEALDELATAGLVRQRSSVYDFDHPRTRDFVYESTALARRRLLHRRAADALRTRGHVSVAQGSPGAVAASIARHLEAAGREAEAVRYLVEAAEEAERLFANREALELYASAAALSGGPRPDLRERMADLETLLGRFEAAIGDLEAAIASPPPSPARGHVAVPTARLERKLAALHRRRGELALAEITLAGAIAHAPANDAAELATIRLEQAALLRRTGDLEGAREAARHARELAENHGEPLLVGETLNAEGMLARLAGDASEARRCLRRSLELSGTPAAVHQRIAALNNLAFVERDAGNLDRAIELTEASLRACVQLGDRHREAALRNNLADLLHASGQREAAMGELRSSVAIFAEVGGTPGELQPEIWRLVEW